MAHRPLADGTSFTSTTVIDNDNAIKLLESLQNDFKCLSMETKKKYPQIKEASEEAIVKLRNFAAENFNKQQQKQSQFHHSQIYYVVNQILYPVVQGCETKEPKIVKMCLGTMQKLIVHQAIDQKGARYITDTLWMLMGSGTELVKLLQSVTLLLTTNCIVQGETLAKNLVLCFRLHFTKDSQAVISTAGATVRQLVSLVFERVLNEDKQFELKMKIHNNDVNNESNTQTKIDDQQQIHKTQTLATNQHNGTKISSIKNMSTLAECASDAYYMFQDLVRLVNSDRPYWLIGITEISCTFGLELLESVLSDFQLVFYKHSEFGFLLKESVCGMVIKLFSPNVKTHKNNGRRNSISTNNTIIMINATSCPNSNNRNDDKPHYAITVRLLRLVSILVRNYHKLLVTECEIFLSLIVKFLDVDKPPWQQSVALEVLHRFVVEPELLIEFCKFYDLKLHSTKIFQDIIDSLAGFIQALFNCTMTGNNSINNTVNMGQSLAIFGNNENSTQSGFIDCSGKLLPIVIQFQAGQAKSVYLEINDRQEGPPQVVDGYGISVAYACLIDIVRAIQIEVQLNIQNSSNDSHNNQQLTDQNCTISENDNLKQQETKKSLLHKQIINSSWRGLLKAFCPLIESCTNENIIENLLKSLQSYIHVCGILDMEEQCKAFICIMCRFCLPLQYNLSVFNETANNFYCTQQKLIDQCNLQYTGSAESSEYKPQQIVVIGSPLVTSSVLQSLSSGNQMLNHGPVMLTNKNLQCMRSLLILAHCHGSIFGLSWHIVLTTLQHLVWILGLKPSTGCFKTNSTYKHINSNTNSNNTVVGSISSSTVASTTHMSVITTAVMIVDLPELSSMLTRLFESSQHLDNDSLKYLIDALCKLSHESMELASSNQEPSLFAIAKLLETGLVNLSRIDILWTRVTNHMLDVCQHSHIRMRQWGIEALTHLVLTALQYDYQIPLRDNQKLQTLILGPLLQLSFNIHGDVRQRQMECVLQVLHNSGEIISHGWPLVLNIIGAVSDRHGENLIKTAFQCLQLVITDFLPFISTKYLPLCLKTTAKFGIQTRELNISLTAIGLMWNIADHFKQNKDKLLYNINNDDKIDKLNQNTKIEGVNQQELVYPDFPGVTTLVEMSEFDKLLMCLFTKLGELCIDPRPAIRKSAGQTLFATISAHANLLSPLTWNAVLSQVLFPLMSKVQDLCESASDSTCNTLSAVEYSNNVGNYGKILLHHSRDTDQKQWAETQVSTLYGLARVFNTEKYSMKISKDFIKAWMLLLQYMENAASNKNAEISLAGLRSLHELLIIFNNSNRVDHNIPMETECNLQEEKFQKKNGETRLVEPISSSTEDEIWECSWTVWMRIASAAIMTIENTNFSQQKVPINVATTAKSSTSTTDDRRHHELTLQQIQHKQQFLTAMLQIFPVIFTHIKTKFSDKDLDGLFRVLDAAVAVEETVAVVLSDSHYYNHNYNQQQLQNYYQQQLTPLQNEILQCIETLERETLLFDDNEFSNMDNNMTRPYESSSTKKTITVSTGHQRNLLVERFLYPLFNQLLKFCRFVYHPQLVQTAPNNINTDTTNFSNPSSDNVPGYSHLHNELAIHSNSVAFGEKAVIMIVDLYSMTAAESCVVKGEILKNIIDVFSVPLASQYSNYLTSSSAFHYNLEYSNSSGMSQQHQMLIQRQYKQQQNTWKLLVVSLMNVLSIGIPLARNCQNDDYHSIWSPLGSVLEDILFPKNSPTSTIIKNNKIVDDYNNENGSMIVDCQLVEFLKNEILSQPTNIPSEFIMCIVMLLNRGSVLPTSSTVSNYPYVSDGYNPITGSLETGPGELSTLREQFAKVCFETLLQFSLVDGILSQPMKTMSINNDSSPDTELVTGKLAVTALLHRFQEVVEKFCHDQNLTGKCPLPRYRMSEISFVLKAISTLIVSLKKTPDKVNNAVWNQLVKLYPSLVKCIPYIKECCLSSQVYDSLTEALLEYGDLLLKMPTSSTINGQ